MYIKYYLLFYTVNLDHYLTSEVRKKNYVDIDV